MASIGKLWPYYKVLSISNKCLMFNIHIKYLKKNNIKSKYLLFLLPSEIISLPSAIFNNLGWQVGDGTLIHKMLNMIKLSNILGNMLRN